MKYSALRNDEWNIILCKIYKSKHLNGTTHLQIEVNLCCTWLLKVNNVAIMLLFLSLRFFDSGSYIAASSAPTS